MNAHNNFTIAAVAFQPGECPEDNINRIIQQISEIKKQNTKVDLIVYGETILNKYMVKRDYILQSSVNISDNCFTLLYDCCWELHVCLSIGISESEGENLYNSQVLINRKGKVISIHRKSNLTASEKKVYKKGKAYITYSTLDGISIGTSICYDLFHQECRILLKKKSPGVLIHSLADPQDAHFTTGYNGRLTSGFYVSANRFGKERSTSYPGHIGILSPSGKFISLKSGKPDIIIETLNVPTVHSNFYSILLRISNAFLRVIHLFKHSRRVIDYLKWNFEMKREKRNR